MIAVDLTIDPQTLVRVRYLDIGGAEHELVAVTCRYVPVTQTDGRRGIAFEVLWDPAEQTPPQPYWCPQGRLRRLLFPPARVRHVRPYQ